MHENTQQVDVIVVSPYSTRMEEVKNGSAKFIRQLLDNTSEKHFLVVNAFGTQTDKENEQGNVKVQAGWKKNSPLPFFKLLRIINQHSNAIVVINFEFNAFGGMLGLVGLALTLLLMKIFYARNVIKVIIHPALLTQEEILLLSDHLSLKAKRVTSAIYGSGMRLFMKYLVSISSKVVVFEEEFKRRLLEVSKNSQHKIIVIPHHIYGSPEGNRIQHRANGLLKALFFGFIVPYKGLDALVQAYETLSGDDYKLTVAGGVSPTQSNQEYFDKLLLKMRTVKSIEYVGYRPDNEIAEIFLSSDVLVLPYKNLLASSGPMAWAIGMEIPFILSSKLETFLNTEDFKKAMLMANVSKSDIVYGETVEELRNHIISLQQDQSKLERLKAMSKLLCEYRSVKNISTIYLREFLVNSR